MGGGGTRSRPRPDLKTTPCHFTPVRQSRVRNARKCCTIAKHRQRGVLADQGRRHTRVLGNRDGTVHRRIIPEYPRGTGAAPRTRRKGLHPPAGNRDICAPRSSTRVVWHR